MFESCLRNHTGQYAYRKHVAYFIFGLCPATPSMPISKERRNSLRDWNHGPGEGMADVTKCSVSISWEARTIVHWRSTNADGQIIDEQRFSRFYFLVFSKWKRQKFIPHRFWLPCPSSSREGNERQCGLTNRFQFNVNRYESKPSLFTCAKYDKKMKHNPQKELIDYYLFL